MSDITEVIWARIKTQLDGLFARVPALSTQVSSLSGTVQGWVDTAKGHADRAKAEADRAGSAATTAVTTRVDALLNGAPAAYDTLKEIADKLANQDDVASALTNQIAGKASTEALADGLAGKADASHTHTTAQVTGLDTALAGKASTQELTDGLAGKADAAVMNARPALFSGTGTPPSSIPNAKVGDWWLNTTTKELSKITGV